MEKLNAQLIMLDLDGTLVDSAPDLAAAVDQMLVALDRPPAGETAVRSWVGNGAAKLVARALSNRMDPDQTYQEGALFDQAYPLFLRAYAEVNGQHAQIYPGVEPALDRWRELGIPLALITNKPMAFTEALLKSLRLKRHFHFIYGGDSFANKKPHPEPLQQVMQQLDADPQQCWMIGDSVNDVEAGRAAGCRIACVDYGYNHGLPIAESQPDQLVSRLDALEFVNVQ